MWILKLNSSSDVDWQKVYGGDGWDGAYEIQQTTDGGYIVVSSSGGAWVLKLDPLGNIEWQKAYGGFNGYGYSVKQTQDGGYIFAGSFYKSDRGDDIWVVKLDLSGNIEWQRTYGGTRIDVAYHVEQTPEGEYVIAGWTNSFRSTQYGPNYDALVMRIDSIGNIGASCGLVDLTSITPVETSISAVDIHIAPQDSTTTSRVTTATVIDSSAVVDAICSETIPQAGQRPLIEIDVSPLSHDFGDVTVGDTSSQIFTVRNSGYKPLEIFNIWISGTTDYTATHNCPIPPDMLDIARRCEITVTYVPTTEGQQSAYLGIESNDPDEGLIEIPISGTGVIPECTPETCPGGGGEGPPPGGAIIGPP